MTGIDALSTQLDSYGLTLDDAERLGLRYLSPAETQMLGKSYLVQPAMLIPYHAPDGTPLPDWPQSPPFFRLRYLPGPAAFGAAPDKHQRYAQPPNTLPVAYYPRSQNWPSIVRDTSHPLLVTEGEMKAAKASKEGFATIGLGGVWSWRAHKWGCEWLPSLDFVAWPKRAVYLVFDSDYKTNPQVCAALWELADWLTRLGAIPHLINLPTLRDGVKTGLDDFLIARGPDDLRALLHVAEPLGLARTLWSLNERLIYIRDPGLVVDLTTLQKTTPRAMQEHMESTASYAEQRVNKDGSVSHKLVPAAGAWLKWPLRASAQALTYRPGAPRLIINSPVVLNTWPGWGVNPREGDPSPFLDLLDHLFRGAEPVAKEWFLRWCAYPLQHPGKKLYSSAVLHGTRHGTGKSLVGYTLGKIYGRNFTEISQGDLHASFNDWAENRQFVLADDITGSDNRRDADLLKRLITQREMRINIKYLPAYTVPDCVNYLFTANHPDAFFLEDDDRRFFVHEIESAPLSDDWYTEYDCWLASNRGAAAVFAYLLALDLGEFNPAAPALRTSAKERMTQHVRSDLAAWVRDLLDTPDAVLRIGDIPLRSDLYTSRELHALYDPLGKTRVNVVGMGRELARAGVRQVCAGRPIKLSTGAQGRYYIIRHPDVWRDASGKQVAEHVEACSTPAKKF